MKNKFVVANINDLKDRKPAYALVRSTDLVVVKYDDIAKKNYSLSAGQYFEVKIEYVDITTEDFEAKMKGYEESLNQLFAEGEVLETEIKNNSRGLRYE